MKINFNQVIENPYELNFYNLIHSEILEFVSNVENTTLWEITRQVRGSDRRVLRLLMEMIKCGEIKLDGKRIYSASQKKDNYANNIVCDNCNGKLIYKDEKWNHVLSEMIELSKQKPTPTFVYDQRPVTLETSVNRGAYIHSRGDLLNKEIVVIGDDDLTSLVLGLSGYPKRVVVFEIDQRLVDFINDVSKKRGLAVEAHKYDLTKSSLSDFNGKFDVFLTDPTPEESSFSLFISVGLRLLKNKSGMSGYISFFPSHQEISIDFQKILCKFGLIITDMIPKFTEYEFIAHTYKESDKVMLSKIDDGGKRLSFYENLTRVQTSSKTNFNISLLKNNNLKLGKATKRVLNNLELDPAFASGEKEFVFGAAKEIEGAGK